MRSFRSAGFLVAAVALLSGCMGSNSSTTPSVGAGAMSSHSQTMSQVKGGGEARPVLKVAGGIKMASCPSQFTGGCYAIDAANPVSFEWCVSSSGNCSSGLVDSWLWSAVVTNAKGKPIKKPVFASWSPNPGNPSTVTISTTAKKIAKKPKYKYGVTLSTCDYSGSLGCFSDFVSYGIAT